MDFGLSQEALRELVDAAPDAIVVADDQARIVFVNRQAELLFSRDRAQLLGRRVEELMPARYRDGHRGHHERFIKDPETRPMGTGMLLYACSADGTEVPVEVSLSPLRSDATVLTVAAIRDVSERVDAERQLREAARDLSLLEDRERIARDLHDTVVQRLFAAGMSLQGVAAMLGRDHDATARIEALVDEIDDAIRDLRTAIYGLSPAGEVGFREQILRVLSEERVTLPSDPRLRFVGVLDTTADEVAASALPALREMVSNVGRHAGATSVEVLVAADRDLVVQVVDDGCGVPSDAAAPGHGLHNLAQRAADLGGTFVLEERPGGGTIATWRVPNP